MAIATKTSLTQRKLNELDIIKKIMTEKKEILLSLGNQDCWSKYGMGEWIIKSYPNREHH